MKLEKILAGFNKTLAQLENFIDVSSEQREVNTSRIMRMEEDNERLGDEIARAEKVRRNVKELLGENG